MEKIEKFKKIISEDLYTQGFNAVPVFLHPTAYSGIVMAKVLGFGYSSFLLHSKNGYEEMSYLNDDFKNIWLHVKRNLEKDPKYIKKIKIKYEEKFEKYKILFKEIDRAKLKEIPDADLLRFFKKSVQAQVDSAGIAHVIEPIGMELEKQLKESLSEIIKDKKEFNHYFVELTKVSKLSFVAKEEKELRKISILMGKSRERALKKHLQKYFWIHNSYVGPRAISIQDLKFRLETLTKNKISNKESDSLAKIRFNTRINNLVKLIKFVTIFQDERKANILKTIGYFGKVVAEICRRYAIDSKLVYNMDFDTINKLNKLEEIKDLKKDLKKRNEGAFFLYTAQDNFHADGKEYKELIKFQKKLSKLEKVSHDDLHGTTANKGNAVGKVIVCNSLAAIEKVSAGDILVASMTRPEYMPALKKAAAIVTDEGGITCHAAIVARELNIPAIIGTKYASKVLKDGMLVEVKANHGVVKILNK